jgi:hypothetical protein
MSLYRESIIPQIWLFAEIDLGKIFHVEGGKDSLTKDKTDLISDESTLC